APLGDSRCNSSRNSSLPPSSSRLRQYSGPVVCSISAFTAARSSCFFFPGQTSGPPGFLLFSSIFIPGEAHLAQMRLANRRPPSRLPVTRVATGDVLDRTNVIFRLQYVSELLLIFVDRALEGHFAVESRRDVAH